MMGCRNPPGCLEMQRCMDQVFKMRVVNEVVVVGNNSSWVSMSCKQGTVFALCSGLSFQEWSHSKQLW